MPPAGAEAAAPSRKLRGLLADPFAAVLALVLLTAPLGVRSRALWVGDETRDAAIAHEMEQTGDFIHPRLAGRGVPEKPFLFYAVVASSYRLFRSVTPTSTRVPAVFFSAVTVLAAAASARRLFTPRAGLLTAVILSTTYLFVVNAHDCIVDVALAAFVSLGFFFFAAATGPSGTPTWNAMFGACAAASLLVKGFVGPALLVALTVPLAIVRRRGGERSVRVSWMAWFLPLGALLFWSAVAYGAGGAASLRELLWTHQAGRFFGIRGEEFSHHRAPFYFYLVAIPGVLFPWSITLPSALLRSFRRRAADSSRGIWLSLAAATAFLSLAGTKRTIYFLPVAPIVSMIVARFLDEKLSENLAPVPRADWLQACAIGVASSFVPLVPALADRRITLVEAAVSALVAMVSLFLFLICGKSQRRLIAGSLGLAIGSLLLLDRYALPQVHHDEATRDFFERARRHVTPTTAVYSYELNEDVLGRACLELPARPIARPDLARVVAEMRRSRALLLVQSSKLRGFPAVAGKLRALESGLAGNRTIGLYAAGESLASGGALAGAAAE